MNIITKHSGKDKWWECVICNAPHENTDYYAINCPQRRHSPICWECIAGGILWGVKQACKEKLSG